MSKRSGFSLLELSIVLVVIATLIIIITKSIDVSQTARLSAARSLTQAAVVNDIPGLILWLETTSDDAFDTTDIADGTSITNWDDISPTNTTPYVATQGTSGSRPLYKKAVLNGLPGVNFDGTNDYLAISNFKANAYMTLFVVGKFSPAALNTPYIQQSVDPASNEGFYFFGWGNKVGGINRGGSVLQGGFEINWFKGYITSIGVIRYDGTNFSHKRNSASFTNTAGSSAANTSVTSNLYIGSEAGSVIFSSGSFGEIIMYDRALTDAEVTDVVNYLTKKWQIE